MYTCLYEDGWIIQGQLKKLCNVYHDGEGLIDSDKANKMSQIDHIKEEAVKFAKKDAKNPKWEGYILALL